MAGSTINTIEQSSLVDDRLDRPVPGLVLVFSEGKPKCAPHRLDLGPLEIGRVAGPGGVGVDDDRMSRRHTRVAMRGGGVQVTGLESRNGTFIDGRRIESETFPKLPRIL